MNKKVPGPVYIYIFKKQVIYTVFLAERASFRTLRLFTVQIEVRKSVIYVDVVGRSFPEPMCCTQEISIYLNPCMS